MHEDLGFLAKIHDFLFESWLYLLMGIVAILLWIGKRHINKLDDVMGDYVSQDTHNKVIERLQGEMLVCQAGLKQENQEILRQIQAVHKRMDHFMEIILERLK